MDPITRSLTSLWLAVTARAAGAAAALQHPRSAEHHGGPPLAHGQRGQATAEYALVLLGVAAVALTLAAWAAKSGKLGDLFDAVVDQLLDRAG